MAEQQTLETELSQNFYEIVTKVVSSEKATRLREFDNKLIFVVKRHVTKPIIKLLIEEEFKKKVKKVNVVNNITGEKRAFVTFVEENAAADIAADMELA